MANNMMIPIQAITKQLEKASSTRQAGFKSFQAS